MHVRRSASCARAFLGGDGFASSCAKLFFSRFVLDLYLKLYNGSRILLFCSGFIFFWLGLFRGVLFTRNQQVADGRLQYYAQGACSKSDRYIHVDARICSVITVLQVYPFLDFRLFRTSITRWGVDTLLVLTSASWSTRSGVGRLTQTL